MVRPFRRIDAVRALAKVDSAGTARGHGHGSGAARRLRRSGRQGALEWWSRGAGVRPTAMRDGTWSTLQAPTEIQPYVELGLTGIFGNLGLVSRPAIETRLPDDPDWPGRKTWMSPGAWSRPISPRSSAGSARFWRADGSALGAPRRVRRAAQRLRIRPRPTLAIEVGNRQVKLLARASELRDETDALSQVVKRYYFAHRLSAQLTRRFQHRPVGRLRFSPE